GATQWLPLFRAPRAGRLQMAVHEPDLAPGATPTQAQAAAQRVNGDGPSAQRQRQPRPPLGQSDSLGWLDVGLMALLVGLAGLVRWPDYLTLPAFTDETLDALRSLAIADGRLQTLVDSSSYNGSLHNYLTAALFRLLGPQIYVPRLLI